MLLQCELCDVKCRSVTHFNFHLMSNDHQLTAKFNICSVSAEMKERTIVAYDFHQIISEERLLETFSWYGLVHDIYFQRSILDGVIKACVVLFDSKAIVNTVFSRGNNHKIDGNSVIFKRRSDMMWNEWCTVIGSPKDEYFLSKHNTLSEKMKDEALDDQLSEFLKAISLNEEQMMIRYSVLRDLEILIKRDFKLCTLQPFGSFLSGVSSGDGDMDVYVSIRGSLKKDEPDNESIDTGAVLDTVVKRLRRAGQRDNNGRFMKSYSSVVPINAARVPIIRLIDGETNLQVDLSFNSQLSVMNSELIKFYIDYDPRVRPLIMLIRYWGRFHHLTGSDKIKNYGLILLLIVFLNQKQILPSVYYLQNSCGAKAQMIDGWNGGFNRNTENVRDLVTTTKLGSSYSYPGDFVSTWTILELAKDFFQMFATLKMDEYVVCPLLGTLMENTLFDDRHPDFPTEMEWEKVKDLQIQRKAMCVQDPFILNFNVTNGVRNPIAMKFQLACKATYGILSSMLSQCGGKYKQKINIMDMYEDTGLPAKQKDLQKCIDLSSTSKKSLSDVMNEVVKRSTTASEKKNELKKSEPHQYQADVVPANGSSTGGSGAIQKSTRNVDSFEPLPSGEEIFYKVTLIFSVDDKFVKYYMRLVDGLNISDEDRHRKMNILWIGFVIDYLNIIWTKGYDMKKTETKKGFFIPSSFSGNLHKGSSQDIRFKHLQQDHQSNSIRESSSIPITITNTRPLTDKNNHVPTIPIDTDSEDECDVNSYSQYKRKLSDASANVLETNERKILKMEESSSLFISDGPIAVLPTSASKIISSPNSRANGSVSAIEFSNDINIESFKSVSPASPAAYFQLLTTITNQNKIENSYAKIQLGARKSFTKVYGLTTYKRVWLNREEFWMKQVVQRTALNLTDNPVVIEEGITKKLLFINADVEGSSKLQCTASFSTDTLMPELFMELEKQTKNSNPGRKHVIDVIKSDFQVMLPHYTMFRLHKWLSNVKIL